MSSTIRAETVAATNYGETKIVLPAGEQKLTVKIGKGEVSETIQLAAGQTIEKDVIVGVGHVTVNALYAEGGDKVESSGLDLPRSSRRRRRSTAPANRSPMPTGRTQKFDLPAGDYVAHRRAWTRPWPSSPSTSAPARPRRDGRPQRRRAGDLRAGRQGHQGLRAKKDIQGKRKEFGYGFDDTHQTTLPAGDYVVATDRRDGSPVKETPASVKAGERMEVHDPVVARRGVSRYLGTQLVKRQERRAACLGSITIVSAALSTPCKCVCRADHGRNAKAYLFPVCPSW